MLKKPLLLAMVTAYTSGTNVYAHQFVEPVQLDQLVVTATKTEREVAKIPVSTEVISREQIEAIGATNLKDIFSKLPSVFINPSANSISIRGVGGKGSLLLIDGRRIGSEYNNSYDSHRISANSIERIEVVKGPAGALYGSDALGGVINIITRKASEGIEATVDFSSGANSDGEGSVTTLDAGVTGRIGKTGFSAWLTSQNVSAYTEQETAQLKAPKGGGEQGQTSPSQSQFKINPNNNKACGGGENCAAPFNQNIGDLIPAKAVVKTTYQSPKQVLNVGGKLSHEVNHNLTVYANAAFMQETNEVERIGAGYKSNYVNAQNGKALPIANLPTHQELDNQRIDLSLGVDFNISNNLLLAWQSSHSHYKKDDSITTPLWSELGYSSQADSAKGGLNGTGQSIATNHQLTTTWTPNETHRLLVGGEYVEDKRIADFFSADGTETTKTIQTTSAFAQHEWQVTDPISLVYGLRYDERTNSDNALTFNAGGVYQVSPVANFRLRYAQGFRSPDSQELHMIRVMPNGSKLMGAQVVADGKQAFDLKSETSQHYEVGVQGSGEDWSYDVAAFHNQIENSIQKETQSDYVTFANASNVEITGVELSASKKIIEDLRFDFNATALSTKNHDTHQRLEYTPDHKVSLAAHYVVNPQLSTQLIAQHIGDQIYAQTVNGQTQYQTADAYTPVNLVVNYFPARLKNTEFYGGVDNILDTDIDTVLGSSVGTYFYAGARVTF